jgi:hypothetical protein
VQRLDASVHDLGETGFFGDFDDFESCFAKLPARAARRKNLDTEFGEALYKRNETTLVRNTDERPSNVKHVDSWEEGYWIIE